MPITEIKFSICQSDVHTINNDIIYYSYVICGFSDVDIKKLSIYWNSKNVLDSSSNDINSNSYFTWITELSSDNKFNIFIKYDSNQFEEIFSEEESEVETDETSNNEEVSDNEKTSDTNKGVWDWGSFLTGILVGVLIAFGGAFILEEFF